MLVQGIKHQGQVPKQFQSICTKDHDIIDVPDNEYASGSSEYRASLSGIYLESSCVRKESYNSDNTLHTPQKKVFSLSSNEP
jgi:hypothetical protein